MFRRSILTHLAALVLFGGTAIADGNVVTVGDLTIEDAKSRPTIPNRPAAIYLMISNTGTEGDRLIHAASASFESLEIHNSEMKDGVISMAPVDGIDVPAGGMVMLKPGGLHLMAFGAPDPLKMGEVYPVALVFEKAGHVTVLVTVSRIDADHGHGGHGSNGGHSGHSHN